MSCYAMMRASLPTASHEVKTHLKVALLVMRAASRIISSLAPKPALLPPLALMYACKGRNSRK